MWGLLIRSQFRVLRRALASTLAAVIGITLGVASVVAVHLVSAQIARSLDASVASHLNSANFIARRTQGPTQSDDYFQLRRQWRDAQSRSNMPTHNLASLHNLYPTLEGAAKILVPATGASAQVQVVGVDWLAMIGQVPVDPAAPASDSSGRLASDFLLTRSDVRNRLAVVLDDSLATKLGLTPEADFFLNGQPASLRGTLPGTNFGNATPHAYLDLGDAQLALGESSQTLSAVALQVVDENHRWRWWLEQFMPGISAVIPRPSAPRLPEVWQVTDVQAQLPQLTFGRSVLFNMGALGLLSLVVAWFLIYQAAVLWLRRQVDVFSRLQVLGVTRSQLRFLFVLVLLLLGVLAALLGLFLGFQLARGLLAASGVANAGLPSIVNDLPFVVGAKALISGVGVAVLAAWLAFARVLRDDRSSRPPWMIGIWLLLILAAGWFGLQEHSGLLGGFMSIAALCVFSVVLLVPVLSWLRRHAASLTGPLLWRMGLRELAWFPADIASALAALTLAIATSIGVATMVDSFRADFARMLEQRLAADVQLEGDKVKLVAAHQWLRQVHPDIQVRAHQTLQESVGGSLVELVSTPLDSPGAARYGFTQPVLAGQALISEQFSRSRNLQVGDSFVLANGSRQVVSVFAGYGDVLGKIVLPQSDPQTQALFAGPVAGSTSATTDVVDLRLDLTLPGTRLTEQIAALRSQIAERFPSVQLQSQSGIRTEALRVFDQTFVMTRGLTFIALVVASVGLYSTILAIGLIQQRSWQLLQVLGLGARQNVAVGVARSLGITVVVLVFALPLGLVMGWLLCQVINPRAFGWSIPMVWSAPAVTTPALLGLVTALITGLAGSWVLNRNLQRQNSAAGFKGGVHVG